MEVRIDAPIHRERDEQPDEAVERLVARGPDMNMSAAQEEAGRAAALEDAIKSAAAAGLYRVSMLPYSKQS